MAFIRQLYCVSSAPYVERKRKIEAEEEPFVPRYSEDGEPPFLEEWLEANDSLHVLAYACVTMLAGALHLYLKMWEQQSGAKVDEGLKKTVFKTNGWFNGYKIHFLNSLSIDFTSGSANLGLIEEIVLARNCIEHPQSIANLLTKYSYRDIGKRSNLFFVDEPDAMFYAKVDEGEMYWLIPPTLHITAEKLFTSIAEIENFAEWFDVEIKNSVIQT
jgi:hypothetical protein